MIGKTSSYRWCAGNPLMASDDPGQPQALMLGAEVVHATHQIHKWFQGFWVTDQGSTAPHQDRQAGAEGGIQALDESGVELGSAMALGQQKLGCFETTPRHSPSDVDYPLALDRKSTRLNASHSQL